MKIQIKRCIKFIIIILIIIGLLFALCTVHIFKTKSEHIVNWDNEYKSVQHTLFDISNMNFTNYDNRFNDCILEYIHTDEIYEASPGKYLSLFQIMDGSEYYIIGDNYLVWKQGKLGMGEPCFLYSIHDVEFPEFNTDNIKQIVGAYMPYGNFGSDTFMLLKNYPYIYTYDTVVYNSDSFISEFVKEFNNSGNVNSLKESVKSSIKSFDEINEKFKEKYKDSNDYSWIDVDVYY